MIKFRRALVLFLALAITAGQSRSDNDFVSAAAALAEGKAGFVLLEFVSRESGEIPAVNGLYADPEVRRLLLLNVVLGREWRSLSGVSGFRGGRHLRPGEEHPLSGVVRVVVEENADLAQELGVSGTPAFLLVSQEGFVTASPEGLPSPKAYADFLDGIFPDLVETPAENVDKSSTPALPGQFSPMPMSDKGATTRPVEDDGENSDEEEEDEDQEEEVAESGLDGDASGSSIGEIDPSVMAEPAQRMVREFSSPLLWTVEMNSDPEDIDLDLEILDPRGEMIAISEKVSGEERVSVAVSPDIPYTIAVYSIRRDIPPVTYRLHESTGPLPEDRIAPSPDPVHIAEPGTPVEFEMRPGVDPHFRFLPMKAGTYRFFSDMTEVSGATFKYTVVNSAGEILGSSRTGEVAVDVESPGSLTFVIASESGEPAGMAEMSVEFAPGRPAPSGVEETARIVPLLLGERAMGRIGGSDGRDAIFRIENPGSDECEIIVSGIDVECPVTLEVLSDGGALMERIDGVQDGEPISISPEESGDIYLRLYTLDREAETPFEIQLYRAR